MLSLVNDGAHGSRTSAALWAVVVLASLAGCNDPVPKPQPVAGQGAGDAAVGGALHDAARPHDAQIAVGDSGSTDAASTPLDASSTSDAAPVDGCAKNNGGCGNAAYVVCMDAGGSSLPLCVDINECANDNGGCNANFFECVNNVGAPPTCVDIDECDNDNGGCGNPAFYSCTNHVGAAQTCADIDECASNNGGCGNAKYWNCTNQAGAPPVCTLDCQSPLIPCSNTCVDPSDDATCGGCNTSCTGPTACGERVASSGLFECLCPNPLHIQCGNACVDPSKSPNCGDCGIACLAGESCNAGTCSCPSAGDIYCDTNGSTAGGYQCIDPVDEENCFGCGVVCTESSRCDAASQGCLCVLGNGNPDPNERFCGGACIDITGDEANCGACDVACPAASTCSAGKCSCRTGEAWCASGGSFACLNVQTDANHCGKCGNKCDAGDDCCDGECVDPSSYTTNAHCGSCGNKCKATGCGFVGLSACTCELGDKTYTCR